MLTIEQFAVECGLDGVERGIAIQLNKSSQLMPLLNIQKIPGLVHKFGREETGGGITRRDLNQPFPDTAVATIAPASERVEIAGAHIKTDHRMVKSNAKARAYSEIARRTRTTGRYVDKQIINGNGNTDAQQIVGMRDKIDAAQVIAAGDNGAVITIAMMEDLIDHVEDQGKGRFVFAPLAVVRQFKRLIVAEAGGASVADATNEVVQYEGVKIIAAAKDNDGKYLLPFTETQGSSNATASVYCFAPGDTDETGTAILMASNSIELIEEGLRDSFYHDQLEVAFGTAIFVHKSAARLNGVLQSANTISDEAGE